MKNIELLNFCKEYPEPFFDLHYSKQARELVISRDKESLNDLQRANALIRRNITALEALLGKNEKAAELKLAAEMVDALEQEGINNSEFTSYWEVNDVSVSIYRSLQKEDRYKFVLEMAKRYIQDRHSLYSAYGYSDTTLQVKADSFAHKRSGGQGQAKVLAMLAGFRMPLFENPDLGEFIKAGSAVILADSTGRALFDEFVKFKALRFVWGPKHENKRPDFLIKAHDHFWIVEHKHMKEFGGGQNKQVNEIIDFVGQSEKQQDVHYVSFLDGILFNRIFLHEGDPKVEAQRSRIVENLSACPNNYFVNTAGFSKIMEPRGGSRMNPRVREKDADYRLGGKRINEDKSDESLF